MKEIIILQLLVTLLVMSSWFGYAAYNKRNDVADIAWGFGFIIAATVALVYKSAQLTSHGYLLFIMVVIWGLRLALHIGFRNHGKGEDRRYKKWREEWGEHALVRAYFQVFLLQGILILVVSLPVTWIIFSPSAPWSLLDYAGLLIWTIGFCFETVGDFQLKQFKKRDPKSRGRFMRSGLWQYSRHPNYFGEVTLWWGIYLMTLGVPKGWWTIIGPLTISYLILCVSGIPMMEEKHQGDPEFEEYRSRTSAFFPLPPYKGG